MIVDHKVFFGEVLDVVFSVCYAGWLGSRVRKRLVEDVCKRVTCSSER